MPAHFTFAREMFTFWATETVSDGNTYFCGLECHAVTPDARMQHMQHDPASLESVQT